MGVLRALFPKKIKDPVRGTAQVVGCTGMSEDATSQTCGMQLVVQVPGREPYAVEHDQMFKASRWPSPGMTLPVTVSASDPNHLRVETKEMPDWEDTARQQAEQLAESMRGGGQPGVVPGGTPNVQIVGLSGDPEAAAQAIARAEQATGMDLNADGTIGAATPAGAGAAAGAAGGDAVEPTQHIEQLERLAELKKSGALSEAEFAAEKAKLLGR